MTLVSIIVAGTRIMTDEHYRRVRSCHVSAIDRVLVVAVLRALRLFENY